MKRYASSTIWKNWIALFLLLLSALSACTDATVPKGTVALVNGQPISFRQLEVYHDMNAGVLGAGTAPSLEALRTQYGRALSDLIVYTLVQQELTRRGLDIDPRELELAEKRLIAEYPEAAFERALQEDSVDLQAWRELLRDRIAMQHFARVILRPSVMVTVDEVGAYYTAHADKFRKPERVRLQSLISPDQAELNAICRAGARKDKSAAMPEQSARMGDHAANSAAVLIDERVWALDSIPEPWRKEVLNLAPFQGTPVRAVNENYQCLVLIERLPAQNLSIVDAYPSIESVLLQQKTDAAFWTWLGTALEHASIQAAPVLYSDAPLDRASEKKQTDSAESAPERAPDTLVEDASERQ